MLLNGDYISPIEIQKEVDKFPDTRDEIVTKFGKLICTECGNEMIFIRECERARSHFRHKVDCSCSGGNGEGTIHKIAKKLIMKHKSSLKFIFICGCNRRIELKFSGTYREETPIMIGENQYRFDIGISSESVVDQAIEVYNTHPLGEKKIDDMNKNLKRWCEVNVRNVISTIESGKNEIRVHRCMMKDCSICEHKLINITLQASQWKDIRIDISPLQELTNRVMSFIQTQIQELKIDVRDTVLYTRCFADNDIILAAGKYKGLYMEFVLRINIDYIAYLAGFKSCKEGLAKFTKAERDRARELFKGRCHECCNPTYAEDWKTLCKDCWRFSQSSRQ